MNELEKELKRYCVACSNISRMGNISLIFTNQREKMMSELEKEILQFIDNETWESKQKIRWTKIEYSNKRTLRFTKTAREFENVIYNLKKSKLITSKDFENADPTQEGLRPTILGHSIINKT